MTEIINYMLSNSTLENLTKNIWFMMVEEYANCEDRVTEYGDGYIEKFFGDFSIVISLALADKEGLIPVHFFHKDEEIGFEWLPFEY